MRHGAVEESSVIGFVLLPSFQKALVCKGWLPVYSDCEQSLLQSSILIVLSHASLPGARPHGILCTQANRYKYCS